MYRKDNLWNSYPLTKSINGQDILFIHIPKCAGTSIANTFGREHLSHYPASIFFLLDEKRFLNSESFAVIRNPIDRVASLISHYSKSQFATLREKRIAQELNLTEENIHENILRYFTSESFRFKLFNFSKPGIDGFPVNQMDYISFGKRIIVDNIFSFSHLSDLEGWLSEKTGSRLTG